MNRSPMRRCGKPYRTEADALASRRGSTGRYLAIPCRCTGWHLRSKRNATKAAERNLATAQETGFSRATCRRIDSRDSQPDGIRRCLHCGASGVALHRHHRRPKGMGGDPRPHTNCPCNAATLCWPCHSWAHAHPRDAEAEGLILPQESAEPGMHPVLVHGGGGGVRAWPACDGRWVPEAPAGRGEAA